MNRCRRCAWNLSEAGLSPLIRHLRYLLVAGGDVDWFAQSPIWKRARGKHLDPPLCLFQISPFLIDSNSPAVPFQGRQHGAADARKRIEHHIALVCHGEDTALNQFNWE